MRPRTVDLAGVVTLYNLVIVYCLWVGLASFATYCLFAWDKRQAGLGRQRVPEVTLLSLATLGGWPGALMASHHFRHKTQKISFRVRLYLGISVHVLSIVLIVYGVIRWNQ